MAGEVVRQLDAFGEKGTPPEHRACQRWVSKLNVAYGDAEELTVLDGIMRAAQRMPQLQIGDKGLDGLSAEEALKWFPPFAAAGVAETGPSTRALAEQLAFQPGSWSVLQHTAAEDREPPNQHDLDIWSCAPAALTFSSPPLVPARAHPVPSAKGASVLSNVLSASECASLIAASEEMGYTQDLPKHETDDGRAPSVVLLATEAQSDIMHYDLVCYNII